MRGPRLVAGLFGPVLIALALSDATKLHVWTNTPAPVAYLASTLLFVGGVGALSMVLVRKRWTGGWRVLVTLLGCLAIAGGLAWLVAPLGWPAVVSGLVGFLGAPWFGGGVSRDTNAQLAEIDVLLASGVFLTFAAYGSRLGGE
jgi:hypothetical protein